MAASAAASATANVRAPGAGAPGAESAGRARADQRRVLARGRARPDHPHVGRAAKSPDPRERRIARRQIGVRREDRARDPGVEGLTGGVAAAEAVPVAGQRTIGAGATRPRELLVDAAPDRDVFAQRRTDPLAFDGTAAQRDGATAGERLEHDPLLELAEAVLAPLGEDRGNRPTRLRFDQRVGVGDLEIEKAAGAERRGRLPGPHEADEGDRWSTR